MQLQAGQENALEQK